MELYHSINSVCAQKVRIALEEKGQDAKDHLMTLRGDQYEPAYLNLNPSGIAPTPIHNGEPITESSLILYYIDDAFPTPPLMPKQPRQRHRVRMYNKLIDEYTHNACAILTFSGMWAPYPAISDWWLRMRERPSVKASVIDRMTEADWAPFKNLAPDPWPKVQELLKAA